jgi:hypothetical protein
MTTRETKRCSQCSQDKPLDVFRTGRAECRTCALAYHKAYHDSPAGKETLRQYIASGRSAKVKLAYYNSCRGQQVTRAYLASPGAKAVRRVRAALASTRATRRAYRASALGKETAREYNRSARGQDAIMRYRQSVKGRDTEHRLSVSPAYKARRKVLYLATTEWLNELKLQRGCMDCGYRAHAVALEFDHRDGEQKRFSISCKKNSSRQFLEEEIAKCDVVCSNCHQIRTHARRLTHGVAA